MESDDGSVKVWEGGTEGEKRPVGEWQWCPATTSCWGAGGNAVYAWALDIEIHVFDIRNLSRVYTPQAHADTRTSLALFPRATSEA